MPTTCRNLPGVKESYDCIGSLTTFFSMEFYRVKLRKKEGGKEEKNKTLLQVDSLFPFSGKHLPAFSRAPDSKQTVADAKFLIKTQSIIEV